MTSSFPIKTPSRRVLPARGQAHLRLSRGKSGRLHYFCSVPGHQLAGMQGQFIVTSGQRPRRLSKPIFPANRPTCCCRSASVTRRLSASISSVSKSKGGWRREPRLATGPSTARFLDRLSASRVGDTVDIHLKNSADSAMIHSVDFHATTGPGGGAAALQVQPGKEKSMTWKALIPRPFRLSLRYADGLRAHRQRHVRSHSGRAGKRPAAGRSRILRDAGRDLHRCSLWASAAAPEFSVEKLLNEQSGIFRFQRRRSARSPKLHPLRAKVGDTVRIFFGVGGSNFTSSFHVIGEIFDKVYAFGGARISPLEGIQTVSVAPGGAVITEFKTKVPGNYTLVDHALARDLSADWSAF